MNSAAPWLLSSPPAISFAQKSSSLIDYKTLDSKDQWNIPEWYWVRLLCKLGLCTHTPSKLSTSKLHPWPFFIFQFWGQGLSKFPRLDLSMQSSCLSLLSGWSLGLVPPGLALGCYWSLNLYSYWTLFWLPLPCLAWPSRKNCWLKFQLCTHFMV